MFAPEVVEPAVDFLARLAGPGPALGFAVGTGRIGVPLVRRGISVTGIELSPAMASRLRAKVSEADLPVVVGDMATTAVPGQFSLVFLVWNSISNLRTQQEQVECFRNAARHLVPRGRFVIGLFVPPLRRLPPGQAAVPFDVSEAHTGFDTFDLVRQECHSPLHASTGRDNAVRRRALPLHLACRMRPDGSTDRDGIGEPRRRLGRQAVHLGKREARLGVAQDLVRPATTRLRAGVRSVRILVGRSLSVQFPGLSVESVTHEPRCRPTASTVGEAVKPTRSASCGVSTFWWETITSLRLMSRT